MRMKKIKSIAGVVLVSALTAVICLFAYSRFIQPEHQIFVSDTPMQVHYASYDSNASAAPTDFTQAALTVIPATVHINTKVPPQEISGGRSGNPFGGFFGWGDGQYYSPGKLASGSGVIISNDGYIVTNNHVVEGASDIIVTLNDNRKYKAKIVGADPNTDLAVLKIDEDNLPYIVFGNSDEVQIGQWVLACGYPLNLQTTVTAGIISAKSRDLGINHEGVNPIETYLQTDAAVNPGNSGGPLVNTNGKLIGINSAIATPTGSFAGYAYAVPSNLVRKVVNDILKYGTVQRAFLGIYMERIPKAHNMRAAFNTSVQNVSGVEVSGVTEDGAAAAAGIQKDDIIVGIDDAQIVSQTDLLGVLARHHPGDKIKVTYLRDGEKHQTNVVLKNKNGTTDIVKRTILDELGAQFRTLTEEQAEQLGIPGGVIVGTIGSSGLIGSQTDMRRGFVIVRVGNYPVKNVSDLKNALEKQGNNVMIRGFYPGYSGMMYYAINDVKSGIVN